jgi:MOSC domain-containing protein YiiM
MEIDIAAPPARDFEPFLASLRSAPSDGGLVRFIVVRPGVDLREVVESAVLDPDEGVVGDSWRARGSASRPDGSANPEAQVTMMSTRVLAAIEPDQARWPLAGDQLLVDADLSMATLPAGTRLAIGEAIVEVSETPHTGCAKFSARFGSDALRWINSPTGRELRMRGVNVRIVQGGTVRVGDTLHRQ